MQNFSENLFRKYDEYFEHPNLIEKKLIEATCQKENEELLVHFFHELNTYHKYLPMVQYDLAINEANIRRVIDLVRKNKWEQEEWNEDNIYTEDFKEICRTPIYIPFISPELLSGEYVVFLLHPDLPETANNISGTCAGKEKLNCIGFKHTTDLSISEEDFGYNKADDKKRRTRFFGDNNPKGKPIIKQFEEKLSVSFDEIFPDYKGNRNVKDRKRTIGWQLFEEYAYAGYDINLASGETEDLLDLLDDNYVANNLFSSYSKEMNLQKRYAGCLLFKTVMFQHLHKSKAQCEMSYFATSLGTLQMLVLEFQHAVRRHMAKLSEWRKGVYPRPDTWFVNCQKSFLKWCGQLLVDIPTSANSPIGEKDAKRITLNEEGIYETVLWRLLIAESKATLNTIRSVFYVPEQSFSEIEKLNQYKQMAPNSPIAVSDWKSFQQKYCRQLEEFFPDKSERNLKNCWLLAIKAILYCMPYAYVADNIPTTVTEEWLQSENVKIDTMQCRLVFAVMHIIFYSSSWEVCVKSLRGRNLQEQKKPKVFHKLASEKELGRASNSNLHRIIVGLRKDTLQDAMIVELRYLMQEYLAGFKLRNKEISDVRNVARMLMDQYLQSICNADDKDVCLNNVKALSYRLQKGLEKIQEFDELTLAIVKLNFGDI